MRLQFIPLLLMLPALIACGGGGSACIERRIAFGFFAGSNCQESNIQESNIQESNTYPPSTDILDLKIRNAIFFMNSSLIVNQP